MEYGELRALFGGAGEYTFHGPTIDLLVERGRLRKVDAFEDSYRVVVTDLGKLAMDLWPATRMVPQ